jgi:hypothetical protein
METLPKTIQFFEPFIVVPKISVNKTSKKHKGIYILLSLFHIFIFLKMTMVKKYVNIPIINHSTCFDEYDDTTLSDIRFLAISILVSIIMPIDTSNTNYGKITFITPEEAFDDAETSAKFASGFSKGTSIADFQYNKALSQELMLTKCESNYVFVALGEEQLNLSVAKACAEVVSSFDLKCAVACVCNDGKKHKGIYILLSLFHIFIFCQYKIIPLYKTAY